MLGLGEKMAGKIDVVAAVLKHAVSCGDRRCWEEQGVKLSSDGTLKSSSVGAPGMVTILNISYWSQKLHLFSLSCHELLLFFFFPILLRQARNSSPPPQKKKSQKSTYYSLSRQELRVLAKMGSKLLTGCSSLALQNTDTTLERGACHSCCLSL